MSKSKVLLQASMLADFTGDGRDDFAVTGSTQFGNTLPLGGADRPIQLAQSAGGLLAHPSLKAASAADGPGAATVPGLSVGIYSSHPARAWRLGGR